MKWITVYFIKQAPAPLIYKTSKQDKVYKQINGEKEILVVLYKKKELNQMTDNDRKKKLNDLKLGRKHSKIVTKIKCVCWNNEEVGKRERNSRVWPSPDGWQRCVN